MKKEVDFSTLSKEDLIEMYKKVSEENEILLAKFKKLQIENDQNLKALISLTEKFKIKQANTFGPKTEVIKDDIVFNEAETEIKKITKKPGRKQGNHNLNTDYFEKHFNEKIIVDPKELKTMKNLIYIGSDETFKVEFIPPTAKIIKVISNKYINDKHEIFQQNTYKDPYPKSICTPSFAANTIFSKFVLGIPYYRQEKNIFSNETIVSRQNLCNYQIRTSEILKPFYEYLKSLLLDTKVKVLHADETTLKVIEVNNKSKYYVWLYSTSFYDNPIYIYEYKDSRSCKNPRQFLANYDGWLITDAYEGYSNIPNVKNSYCWVHARRNFVDILKTLNDEQKSESISFKIVELIDTLFKYENEFRVSKKTATDIKKLRNSGNYIVTLNNIFAILHNANAEPGSAFFKAVDYLLKRENNFKSILQNGFLDLSNNLSERAIKPFVIARKNFLFSNTESGAVSSTILFSIVQTARENGLDVLKYLEYLIKHVYLKDISFDRLLPRKTPQFNLKAL